MASVYHFYGEEIYEVDTPQGAVYGAAVHSSSGKIYFRLSSSCVKSMQDARNALQYGDFESVVEEAFYDRDEFLLSLS